ncbi:MAG: ATP-binding protein [Phycisphaerales bacterium]|nr:MAG: ATP-binding protein [Phycisphaerales bacterium]
MTSGTPVNCSIIVESRTSVVGDVCNEILAKLEGTGFAKDDIFAVHLALEEALANAIKHGNKLDPSKKVTIDCSVDSERIEISMTDEGCGFDPDAVPDPRLGKNLYRPEGRGLFLMKSYMDVVKYNERGNGVRMVRYRERPNSEQTEREDAQG